MHLIVVKHQICQHREHLEKSRGQLREHIVYLPRKKHACRKETCVDRQTADEDAGCEHTDDIEARGNDGHVAGQIDDRIVRLADKPKANDGQNGRHAVDGDTKTACSGVIPALPVADHILVLRIGKKRIEKVREPSDVKHDDNAEQDA